MPAPKVNKKRDPAPAPGKARAAGGALAPPPAGLKRAPARLAPCPPNCPPGPQGPKGPDGLDVDCPCCLPGCPDYLWKYTNLIGVSEERGFPGDDGFPRDTVNNAIEGRFVLGVQQNEACLDERAILACTAYETAVCKDMPVAFQVLGVVNAGLPTAQVLVRGVVCCEGLPPSGSSSSLSEESSEVSLEEPIVSSSLSEESLGESSLESLTLGSSSEFLSEEESSQQTGSRSSTVPGGGPQGASSSDIEIQVVSSGTGSGQQPPTPPDNHALYVECGTSSSSGSESSVSSSESSVSSSVSAVSSSLESVSEASESLFSETSQGPSAYEPTCQPGECYRVELTFYVASDCNGAPAGSETNYYCCNEVEGLKLFDCIPPATSINTSLSLYAQVKGITLIAPDDYRYENCPQPCGPQPSSSGSSETGGG